MLALCCRLVDDQEKYQALQSLWKQVQPIQEQIGRLSESEHSQEALLQRDNLVYSPLN